MTKGLSVSKLRKLIKEETAGAAEYRKLGLIKLANDEARHVRVLKRQLVQKTKSTTKKTKSTGRRIKTAGRYAKRKVRRK